MAVKIRLARKGRKQMPIYDIVVADARAPRDGKFIEKLGQYNPHSTPAQITLKVERALYWLQVGAQPTDTTRKVLSVKGVMFKKHLQIGVDKGAITQETADSRYDAWLNEKEVARNQKIANLSNVKEKQKTEAKESERKKKEEKEAAILKAEQDLIAAASLANAPVVEETEDAPAEEVAVQEVVAEEPTEVAEVVATVEEVVAETPATEVAVEEVIAEAPSTEVAVEEVIAEAPAEEVVAAEAPAEEVAPEAPSEEAPEKTEE